MPSLLRDRPSVFAEQRSLVSAEFKVSLVAIVTRLTERLKPSGVKPKRIALMWLDVVCYCCWYE
jgi:hypothetical protein